MVRRLAPLLLAACGRIGFDATVVDDALDLGSICTFSQIVVVKNGIAFDDTVGSTAGNAIATACNATTRFVSQDDAGVLAANGRPLLPPSELIVIGGGDGPNRAIAYLHQADTPITWSSNPSTLRERATNRLIVQGTTSASHDYAFVLVIREPIGGSTVVSLQGFGSSGTRVAGDYFIHTIAPMLRMSEDAWVIVEWTDTDATAGPSPNDSVVLVDAG